MRKGLLAFGLLVLGVLPAGASSPFSSIQDGFVVLFPQPPYVETRTVDIAEARGASIRMYRVDEPRTEWLISATDVTGMALDLRHTLSGVRDGVVQRSGGTVVSERPVRIGHYDGIELRLERPDRSVIRARICVTPRRIFQAIVMTAEEPHRLSQIERFLDSFAPEATDR